MPEDTFDYDFDLALALERICAVPRVRRELLWLRAKEKEDHRSVRDLERAEPGLKEEMAELVAGFVARGERLDTAAARREGFGKLQDERFAYWARVLGCGPGPA
jgi:hypothetical protein